MHKQFLIEAPLNGGKIFAPVIEDEVKWQETFVTSDKVYCVFWAESEAQLRAHLKKANLRVSKISEVKPSPKSFRNQADGVAF